MHYIEKHFKLNFIMGFRFPVLLATLIYISCIFKTSLGDKSCNEFVDEILSNIKSDKEYFEEPYKIPEDKKSFAIYEIDFGYIYGLSSLHRFHDVITLKKGKYTYLKVHLAAGKILIKSNVRQKYLNFGKSANIDVTIPLAEMTFDIVSEPDGSQPMIKDFKLNEVKGLDIKVSGVGLIRDFLLNAFLGLASRFFQDAVKFALEGKLKRFLKDKVLDYPIPSECLNNIWE